MTTLAPWPYLTTLFCLISSLLRAEVVINEIHYDPEPKTEPVEFIELYNTGAASVDLSGWRFSSGIEYTFPDGSSLAVDGYLVIAENATAYNSKFGSIFVGGAKASGEFAAGTLSNDGERVALRDAQGALIDEVSYDVGFPWPTASQGEGDPESGNGVSMELLHPSLDNDLGGSWRAAKGAPTPGKVNTVFAEPNQIPPHLRQVKHSPRAPISAEAVTISVKVTDPDGVGAVTLQHQSVEPGGYIRLSDDAYASTWETLAMRDDGVAPDEMANDDIYSVAMPEGLQEHRYLTRYRITAEDLSGNSLQVPYADDPQPNFAYFTYNGVPGWEGAIEPGETPTITFSAETMNSIVVYHLIATRADIEAQQWGGNSSRSWEGTIVYDGQVYDHIRFSKRGRASLGQVGKEKWDWNFNRAHRFQARDNYGKPYGVKWREINVLPGTNPWWGNNVSTDGTILNESVGFRAFQLIGSPASNTSFFQMRVISQAAEAPGNQYEGDFWGLYIAIQDPDNQFLQERELPDGNLYNWHGGGVKKNQGANSVENDSDYREFTGILRRTTPLEVWQEKLNFDAYYSFNLGNLIVNNSDMRPGENMMSYIHPNGQTYPIPWDLDLTFETAPHLGRGDTPAWENLYHVLSHPEVDTGYQSRAREVLDLLFNGDQSNMLVDEFSRFVWVDIPESSKLPVASIRKSGSAAFVTMETPHGFETGNLITVDGVIESAYNGDKTITKVSDTEFSFKDGLSIFTPAPEGAQIVAFKSPEVKPLVLADQAVWDHHPRKRKKGIYYKNINGIESEDFKGYQAYMKEFIAPGGYGHNLVASHIDDQLAPNTPTITYAGEAGFPIDGLRFDVSDFDGNGTIFAPQNFAALQWRIAQVTDRSRDDFDPDEPRMYEIDATWQSGELTEFSTSFEFPSDAARGGRTYRVRARMQADNGHWSHWSVPIQFVSSGADVSIFSDSLVITELMYNPAELTEAEQSASYGRSDFEFIELKNIGDTALDLSEVRFTKGIDFDFAGSAVTTLEPGAFVLVVSNVEAFALRYGAGLPVAGAFSSGQLGNGGELLKLSLGAGTAIREFRYDDEIDWPISADGAGHSLILATIAADLDLNAGASWRASARVHGSPGADDQGMDVNPGPTVSWTSWLEAEFSAVERTDLSVSGPDADPDGDGRSNILEYGLLSAPKVRDQDAAIEVLSVDPVRLRHSFVNADDIIYTIEASEDLTTWNEATDLEIELGANRRTIRLAGIAPVETFYRLRVTISN